jgi:hypothetical protein
MSFVHLPRILKKKRIFEEKLSWKSVEISSSLVVSIEIIAITAVL